MIFPSIDLMDGKVVQLVQGQRENKKVELDEPLSVAEKYSKYDIQVIDLDAAMSKNNDEKNNLHIVKELCEKYKCRVGGGIRTIHRAKEIIESGAIKIIIGSSVFENNKINHSFLKELNEEIGKDKIIIAIDSKDGKIVIKGWKESTDIDPVGIVKELEQYCSEFLYTYVDKEGMMQGTDLETLKKLKEVTRNVITAAGGISSQEEIEILEKLGINSVLGMALYMGKIKLS